MYQHSFTAEFGIIAVAVCNELLKTLVGRDIISPKDVRDILERAIHEVRAFPTEPAIRAADLIEGELLPRFTESGGE